MNRFAITLPTCITLIRLSVSPFIMPTLLVMRLPAASLWTTGWLAGLFAALGATDSIDGYIARAWCQESFLGALLDPIADKVLMFSSLIALVSLGRVSYLSAIVLIGREFLVMGLREVALAHGALIPVVWSGKVKMFLQIIYITIVIINSRVTTSPAAFLVEHIALVAALTSTIYSACVYFQYFFVVCKTS